MNITLASRIEVWPIEKLVPYERNSRVHPEEQINQIMASMVEFGFNNPILIDAKDGVIAGHGRLEAAKRLGMDSVPVIQLDHLTDAQKRAYVIADNKIGDNSHFDEALLAAELAELQLDGFDLDVIGFSDEELESLLDDDADEQPGASAAGPDGNIYTTKVTTPIYEPKGEKPSVTELYDATKHAELLAEINAAKLPDDIKRFLVHASYRHVRVNYQRVAEFYAHTKDELTRKLFERNALVIIDYDAAIEGGYVKLTQQIMQLSGEDMAGE